jgi:NAD(P)-dependent dehydrogenase (short-subunit alcohol dehydrogenase family)
MDEYSDKNVVITGGGSGMGFAMAKLLVDGGARVVITGRSQATLDVARERLGKNAVAVRGDVASLSDLDALADRVKGELGTLEALFVNAGVARTMPFESTTEEFYDELFAINVKGAYFTVQKLAPLLSTGAGVVLTTSIANVIGMPTSSVYAAGKAALRSLARSLASELLPRGIRVNAVSAAALRHRHHLDRERHLHAGGQCLCGWQSTRWVKRTSWSAGLSVSAGGRTQRRALLSRLSGHR